ncbi:helix-turn-helix transcriptional regulator [Egibacter rhizosphaerae]|nr:YafY family protein [Egibacter rhizosphaerae]
MDPTSRMLQLLGLLQARREWSGEQLAERLGVTPRTLRRDISRLRDLGYAIDSAAGTEGGYRLARGQALPPLVLNEEEAVAVAVGLRTATTSGVTGVDESAVSALAKLETSLPAHLRGRVVALGADTVQLGAAGPYRGVDPDTLAVIAQASRQGEQVRIAYRDRTGTTSRRDIDPYRLVRTERRWYLVARDVRKDAWRTLRVDRITEVAPLGTRVASPGPPDPAAMVAEAVAFGMHQRRVIVRLMIPVTRARRFIPPTEGTLEPDGERATLMELGGDDPYWVARYLLSLGCRFEVVEGDDLVEELHRLGAELLDVRATPR